MQPATGSTEQQLGNFQNVLRMLEIEAHSANVSMDRVLTLIERQFILAELQRAGNVKGAAEALHRSPAAIYCAMKRLKLTGKRSEP